MSTEAASGPSKPSDPAARAITLSAVVAHELNNVCVAMGGFLELASVQGASHDLVLQSLHEMRIGLKRINSLSADLESLADAVSEPVPIRLRDCIPDAAGRPTDIADQLIRVDAAHARRAVDALARLAKSPLELARKGRFPAAAACAGCGAGLSQEGGFIGISATGLRLPADLTARDPLNPIVKSHALRRLVFTVMIYNAHSAGGHLTAQPAEDNVTLLFPVP